jgi:hypothetical protein
LERSSSICDFFESCRPAKNAGLRYSLLVFGQGFVVFVDGFGGDFGFHLQPKKLN